MEQPAWNLVKQIFHGEIKVPIGGDGNRMQHRQHTLQRTGILMVIGFFMVMIAIVITMDRKNANDLMKNTTNLSHMLESSIKAHVISTSLAAREIIDIDKFDAYDSSTDAEKDGAAYMQTLTRLRQLQKDTGSKYIYALKRLDDEKYYFVFDTDPENETIESVFVEYEPATVHAQAFMGREAAELDMSDEYGRYHTGAVPIRKNNRVIGIISTDVDNTLWDQGNNLLDASMVAVHANFNYLAATITLAMLAMLLLASILLRRLQTMQNKLFRLANYDTITGLPNRQYLMDYLAMISAIGNRNKEPFALLFIDLDNFKKINDNAGHDAGDALLRHIAAYLDSVNENARLFHPSAGVLNVSARVGGDEFIQIFPGVSSETDAGSIAQKILDNFSSQALSRYIEKYKIGLSIGIALYPFHSENYNVLIKYADVAMYHAKNSGKNAYRIYEDEMRLPESATIT